MKQLFWARYWREGDLWVARVVARVGTAPPEQPVIVGCVTQAEAKDQIEYMVRDLIATMLDFPDPNCFDVWIEEGAGPVEAPQAR